MKPKIAFCFMVHDNPKKIREFFSILIRAGHDIYVHLDASITGDKRDAYISSVTAGFQNIHFVSAVASAWGSWNLVAGTLNLVKSVIDSGIEYSHLQLLSGSDLPIQNLKEFENFLTRNPNCDFIEAVDIQKSTWVVHGPEIERFKYTFPFNWRKEPRRFEVNFALQKAFRITRKPPCGIRPHLGSQWWTLRHSTCAALLKFLDEHPLVIEYFKKVLIPDESFFQSLIPHLIKPDQIVPRTLTLYKFNSCGVPFVFYDDHIDLLIRENFFFARKVSPNALELQNAMFNRATEGPPIDWDDFQAGILSLGLLLEARRAFEFREPMIGHIGDHKWRQAIRIPLKPIILLVCATNADCTSIHDQVKETEPFNCLEPTMLPPFWGLDTRFDVSFHSFLVNEINQPNQLPVVVTTYQRLESLASNLQHVRDIKFVPAFISPSGDSGTSYFLNRHPLESIRELLFLPQELDNHTQIPTFKFEELSTIIEWARRAPTVGFK